ncbi:MAG: Gfo/Idh/MocA family oxidoreductase, partial [Thermogutta sp.]|nr:Gfo/Idh/MocA family oxidoreductase [Thermogutta sp.]
VAQLARKGLLGKARARPDLVKKVLAKLRRDGFWATFQSVRTQLDRWMPLGYSAAGRVVAVGEAVRRFRVGQAVACAGAGAANHAEYNRVPELLAAAVPEGVPAEAAAYATLGAIALQGVRNADARLGECVAVIGLGLLGQLAVQLLHAAGCRVVGLDPVEERRRLAAQHGAELVLPPGAGSSAAVRDYTRGLGADAVLITAATASNTPVESAAELARDRARVVMVGVTGMNIPRKPYYEKELTFIVSRSYGPGRYDPHYEQHGHDYPPGYVRWTEGRNLEAFLDLTAAGAVRPEVLTTHRFPIDRAAEAFELILKGTEPYLGVLLTYPAEDPPETAGRIRIRAARDPKPVARDSLGVSFAGSGSFAQSVLLPELAKLPGVRFRGIVTASGVTAKTVGEKYGFAWCAGRLDEILADPETDVVFIVTRHSQHAEMICKALAAGKAVFCEKPLAIDYGQLERICRAVEEHAGPLMVGFNRRFAPLAGEMKRFLADRGPLRITYRVNAGTIPADHWLADPAEGGRVIGEACHFVDLMAYWTGARPVAVSAEPAGGGDPRNETQAVFRFSDGSVGHLMYTPLGPPGWSKERIEAVAGGRAAVLEDFRSLELMDAGGSRRRRRAWNADKGHRAMLEAWLSAVREGRPLITPEELAATTAATFAAAGLAPPICPSSPGSGDRCDAP